MPTHQTGATAGAARRRTRGADPGPPTRRAHPAVAVAVGIALVVTLAGSVALPVLLGSRSARADASLRSELTGVAAAQERYRDGHGTYSADLAALHLPAGAHDLAVVRAGEQGYCVGAHDGAGDTTLFFSPAGGFSARSCG